MHIIRPMTGKLSNWMSMSAKSCVRIENKLHPFGRLIKGGGGQRGWPHSGEQLIYADSLQNLDCSFFFWLAQVILYVHYNIAVAPNTKNFCLKGGVLLPLKRGFAVQFFLLLCSSVFRRMIIISRRWLQWLHWLSLVIVGCSGCVAGDLKVQVLQAPSNLPLRNCPFLPFSITTTSTSLLQVDAIIVSDC